MLNVGKILISIATSGKEKMNVILIIFNVILKILIEEICNFFYITVIYVTFL